MQAGEVGICESFLPKVQSAFFRFPHSGSVRSVLLFASFLPPFAYRMKKGGIYDRSSFENLIDKPGVRCYDNSIIWEMEGLSCRSVVFLVFSYLIAEVLLLIGLPDDDRIGFWRKLHACAIFVYRIGKPKMIETKDLILRQGTAEDWEDLYRNLWSREEVFRYMFNHSSSNEEAGKKRTALYAQMHKDVQTEFFVCEKASGQTIGIAGIKKLELGHWTITDIAIGPDFQGKGYGKQVVKCLLKLAFSEYGAIEVAYDCFTQNAVSKQLALFCGFTYSRSEEAELMKNGEKVILDHYIHTGNA